MNCFAIPEIIGVKVNNRWINKQKNSLTPYTGVWRFFLSLRFSTYLLASLAGRLGGHCPIVNVTFIKGSNFRRNFLRSTKQYFKKYRKSIFLGLIVYFSIIMIASRDSGNEFRIPEIASFILLLFLHVVSSRFFKRKSFFGTDFCFWSWLGLTRNRNVKSRSYFAYVPLITQDPTTWAQPYPYLPTPIQPLPLPPL